MKRKIIEVVVRQNVKGNCLYYSREGDKLVRIAKADAEAFRLEQEANVASQTLETKGGDVFNTIFRVNSKADKRAEYALFNTTKLYADKLALVEEILSVDGLKGIQLKTTSNKKLGRFLVFHYLGLDSETRSDIRTTLVRLIIKEVAMHELPLNSLVEQVELRIRHLIDDDSELVEHYTRGEVSNVFASILVGMALYMGLFVITKKQAKTTIKGHTAEYDLAHPSMDFSKREIKYLQKKNLNEPSNSPIAKKHSDSPEAYRWFSGDSIKVGRKQPQFVWDRLNKISSFAYQVNDRLWDSHKSLFMKTFMLDKDLGIINEKEALKFEAVVEANIGEPLYFDAKYTSDNGRINLVGHYLGAQVGARNYLIEVHEDSKEFLTPADVDVFEELIDGLKDKKDLSSILERASYIQALLDHANGLKVGVLTDIDGKLSGQQSMAELTRSVPEAYASGLLVEFKDGYKLLASEVGLTREATKGGFQGYQYGGGRESTLKGIVAEGGRSDIDFQAWEDGFKSIFPSSYKLMKFISKMTRNSDLGDTIDYVTTAGFNARVVSYETFSETYNNFFGRDRNHSVKVLKSNDFGAQIVALCGHMPDASKLAFVLDESDFHILPVHDNFRCLVGNRTKVFNSYVKASKYHVSQPILHEFVNQIFSAYADKFGISIDVSELIRGDLTPDDVVSGLF